MVFMNSNLLVECPIIRELFLDNIIIISADAAVMTDGGLRLLLDSKAARCELTSATCAASERVYKSIFVEHRQ